MTVQYVRRGGGARKRGGSGVDKRHSPCMQRLLINDKALRRLKLYGAQSVSCESVGPLALQVAGLNHAAPYKDGERLE